MNEVAKILNDFKRDSEKRQLVSEVKRVAEPLQNAANHSSNEKFKKFMEGSMYALNVISSKEEAYIATFEKIKDVLSNSPLGKLVMAYHGPGFEVLFTALIASRDATPLSNAINVADKTIRENISIMKEMRREYRFDAGVMGQGVVSHCFINHEHLKGLSKEQINHYAKTMNIRGRKIAKAFDLVVVQMVELSNVLNNLGEQIKGYNDGVTEKSNNFKKIFNYAIQRDWDLLKITLLPDYNSEIKDFISVRNKWGNWGNLTSRNIEDYGIMTDSNS